MAATVGAVMMAAELDEGANEIKMALHDISKKANAKTHL